ncbi:MAG: acyltransferase [Porticoccaceae bacterium]|nr:acyltransferase [Porticoccaceae bacterium]
MKQSNLSYRAEIDGLRAIAVISVILYHAQMVLRGTDWFEGGYIGVDIFFVISGYLITRIILSELQANNSFSFLNFYERRARRILPMLFVVIFVSIPYAWKKLLPFDLIEYAESILASLFFGSNFFFYFNTTEYGADSALLKPFLHTWSLGVEEQFYLVFPVFAIIAFKFFRKYFLAILIFLSLSSLLFSELMEVRNSNLNFYLPFSRFWELAVGSVLAYRELNCKSREDIFLRRLLPMVGLFLIAYGVLFFDEKTPHPSFHTIIPILGVGLIIGFASKDELIGKFLGSKPLVWVGLISYSAYLWHFPIFAFFRYGANVSSNLDKLGWIAATILLSAISFYMIEQPFRKRRIISPRLLSIALVGSLFFCMAMAYAVIDNEGFNFRFEKITVKGFENYEIDNKKLREQSWILLNRRIDENPDFFDVENRVLLVGNSHAKDVFNAFEQNRSLAPNFDFLNSSAPQLNCFIESINDYEQVRRKFYTSSQYKDATLILVSTRYRAGHCEREKEYTQESSDIEGLEYLINQAKADGKAVIVLGNTAEFKKIGGQWTADMIVHRYYSFRLDNSYQNSFDQIRKEADALLFEVLNTGKVDQNERIEEIARKNGVPYLDKVSLICELDAKACSAFTDEGHKTLYDYGHWTLEGAQFFGKEFLRSDFFARSP